MYKLKDWIWFRLDETCPLVKGIVLYTYSGPETYYIGYFSHTSVSWSTVFRNTNTDIKEVAKDLLEKKIINNLTIKTGDNVYISLKQGIIKTLYYQY